MKLTLISRAYCHLCHDMEIALASIVSEFKIVIEVLDVDADPELEARYGELVPVLLHEERELCHYFLDIARIRDYLTPFKQNLIKYANKAESANILPQSISSLNGRV